MVEPEMAYAGLDELMELAENFLQLHRRAGAGAHRGGPEGDWAATWRSSRRSRRRSRKISYDEAAQMLNEAHEKGLLEHAFEYGNDFGSPDETYISSQFDRPVMVHRYPAAVKAFYMEPDPVDPKFALCVDVLAPEGYGEIIGGSQRMSSYELLKERIEEHRLPLEAFQWYLDLRRYGSVPHSRVRDGHRAGGGVDLRAGACAGDDPVCKDAEPDLSLGKCLVGAAREPIARLIKQSGRRSLQSSS